MYLLRFSVVGRKLRGKKLSPLCPEIILDCSNSTLHDWHYTISRASLFSRLHLSITCMSIVSLFAWYSTHFSKEERFGGVPR
jgi:hypothetical protein